MKVKVLKKFGHQEKETVINIPDTTVDSLIKQGIVKKTDEKLTSDKKPNK